MLRGRVRARRSRHNGHQRGRVHRQGDHGDGGGDGREAGSKVVCKLYDFLFQVSHQPKLSASHVPHFSLHILDFRVVSEYVSTFLLVHMLSLTRLRLDVLSQGL